MSDASRDTVLHIDWVKCDGRGLCTELLPDVLGRDEWGYPAPKTSDPAKRSNVPISPRHLEAAIDAVALCPLAALTLLPQRP